MANSTFWGNSAGSGGAISQSVNGISPPFRPLPTTVINSTFSGNSATSGGAFSSPGALFSLTLKNTIVANTSGETCSGRVGDGGNNIEFPGTDCGFTINAIYADPQLDPAGLADNGGPTPTIAVEAGSPAINSANEVVCRSAAVRNLDQRGFVRPGVGATNCSIGAYEYNAHE